MPSVDHGARPRRWRRRSANSDVLAEVVRGGVDRPPVAPTRRSRPGERSQSSVEHAAARPSGHGRAARSGSGRTRSRARSSPGTPASCRPARSTGWVSQAWLAAVRHARRRRAVGGHRVEIEVRRPGSSRRRRERRTPPRLPSGEMAISSVPPNGLVGTSASSPRHQVDRVAAADRPGEQVASAGRPPGVPVADEAVGRRCGRWPGPRPGRPGGRPCTPGCRSRGTHPS